MASFAVNLKCSDRNKTAWESILNIFQKTGIKCSKLNATNEGFKAFMSSDIDVDNLFSEGTLGELGEIRCTPIKPAYFRENRTIIVKVLIISL